MPRQSNRKALRTLPADPGIPLQEFMVQLQIPFDGFRAKFTNESYDNKDEVRDWWRGSSALVSTLLLPVNEGDGSDTFGARTDRAKTALAALDLRSPTSSSRPSTYAPAESPYSSQ